MIQFQLCPVCGGEANYSFESRYVEVAMCKAESCGHLFALNAAPDDGVQTHPDPDAERRQYADRNTRLVKRWIRDGFLTDGCSILDVGAGAGHVSEAIGVALREATIACVEADRHSRARLATNGWKTFAQLHDCDERFDAILLIEVIEHVDVPVKFLALCAERLTPRGRIFMTTPCGQLRNGSRQTNAYDTKEHVQFFTEKSLRRACDLAGLEIEGFLGMRQLYPPQSGARRVIEIAKSAVRPLRDATFGFSHLVSYVRKRGNAD